MSIKYSDFSYFSSKKQYNGAMKNKKDIRIHIKSLFQEANREDLREQDTIIQKKIIKYITKNNVQNICIYESMPDEVDTRNIIQELEERGKSLYIPQIISETEMILIDSEYEVYEDKIDLFIIPGRAFTQSWKRLGRGKWYYDRFLAKKQYKNSKKIGIWYNFQILENIPTDSHDIPMNIIISK